MKFLTSLSLFLGLAAAQQTTTTSASSASASSGSDSDSNLPSLVAELPTCALSCFQTAAKSVGCATTDFSCLCASQSKLIASLGPCIITSSCKPDEINTAKDVAPKICEAVENDPDASAVASASAAVTSAIGTTSTPNGAYATPFPVAAMGMAGAAAVYAAYGI